MGSGLLCSSPVPPFCHSSPPWRSPCPSSASFYWTLRTPSSATFYRSAGRCRFKCLWRCVMGRLWRGPFWCPIEGPTTGSTILQGRPSVVSAGRWGTSGGTAPGRLGGASGTPDTQKGICSTITGGPDRPVPGVAPPPSVTIVNSARVSGEAPTTCPDERAGPTAVMGSRPGPMEERVAVPVAGIKQGLPQGKSVTFPAVLPSSSLTFRSLPSLPGSDPAGQPRPSESWELVRGRHRNRGVRAQHPPLVGKGEGHPP